jgi:hypothetical protein
MSTTTLTLPRARFRSTLDNEAIRRVLVAIVLHSDEEGLTCRASDEVLADSASVLPDGLADALLTLTEVGWIQSLIVPAGHRLAGRMIVLMDHEAAGWYLAETRKSLRPGKSRDR